MTLSDLLPQVQDLPVRDKLTLIRVLAEALAAGDDISPLTPNTTYYLPTPYGIVGAGNALIEALEEARRDLL